MSQFTPTEFRTRTGRIVWSGGDRNSLYEPKTTDYEGNPLTIKSGPDAGKPTQRFEFGVAIAKLPGETHWASCPEGAVIWAQGHKDHPHSASRPDFAWKVTDGDSQTPGKPKNGKPGRRPCDKEGFPGHWVFSFSSSYAIRFVNAKGTAHLLEKDAVKVGDYVQVSANVVGNIGATPGVYLNHSYVSLQGRGDPISNGPDPASLGFGDGPQPAGMQPVIGAPNAGTPPPPAAATVAPTKLPSATPPPPAAAVAPLPPTVVTPNPAILATAPPPPPAAAAPPPPPAAPQMTAQATHSYASYKAGGWTDEMLRAQGLMV